MANAGSTPFAAGSKRQLNAGSTPFAKRARRVDRADLETPPKARKRKAAEVPGQLPLRVSVLLEQRCFFVRRSLLNVGTVHKGRVSCALCSSAVAAHCRVVLQATSRAFLRAGS